MKQRDQWKHGQCFVAMMWLRQHSEPGLWGQPQALLWAVSPRKGVSYMQLVPCVSPFKKHTEVQNILEVCGV